MSAVAQARAAELLSLLGDRSRLLILAEAVRRSPTGAAALSAAAPGAVATDGAAPGAAATDVVSPGATIGEVATAVGVPVRQAGDACARLVALGLLTHDGGRFVARLDGLRDAARDLDAAHPITALLVDYPRLKGVFSHGRLVSMPVRAVHGADLANLVVRFVALDGPVDEPEINRRLAAICDDVAALRRLMVDEGVVRRDPAGTTYSNAR